MDRRNFLKSAGATALLPALPIPVGAIPVTSAPGAMAAVPFSEHTYQWAEMIVRAHNKCNLGLLQRSLRIDATAAAALKNTLIENGIVAAQANAYGIHTATKPLYEGAFMKVSDVTETANKISEKIAKTLDTGKHGDPKLPEKDPENSPLDAEFESDSEPENFDHKVDGTA